MVRKMMVTVLIAVVPWPVGLRMVNHPEVPVRVRHMDINRHAHQERDHGFIGWRVLPT